MIWKSISYEVHDKKLFVDESKPPFDGGGILVNLGYGLAEVYWVPQDGDGEDAEGFYWMGPNGKTYELDDLHFFIELPHLKPMENCLFSEESILVHSKEHGWVEAWFDQLEQVWQALDAEFTIEKYQVDGWAPLPEVPGESKCQMQ